jgi:WD40 repeat protein
MKCKIYIFLLSCSIILKTYAQDSASVVLSGHTGPVNSIDISPDGKTLISGGKDETVRVWDLGTNTADKTISTKGSSVKRVTFNPEGTKFLTALYCQFAEFDRKTLKKRISKNIHTSFIETCVYSPDGSYILTSSWRDKTLVICKTKNLKKYIETEESVWIDNAIFNRSGKLIFSGGHDNLVKMWDAATGGMISSYAGHDDWVYDLCLSPDEKFLYTASFDKTVKFWDLNTGKNIYTLKGHTEGLVCIDISRDGKYLATGSSDKEIIIWDIAEKKQLRKLSGHEGAVMDVQFSADNKTLYSCSIDKTIRIWKLNLN